MRHRAFVIRSILLFSCGVLIFTLAYGPLRRTFAVNDRAVQVSSSAEIKDLWESAGVRGRIAVLFTRNLDAEEMGNVFQEDTYIQRAMHEGIVRTVYYVVPDSAWNDVVNENRFRNWISPHKPTSAGFAMLFEEGRVNVLPLSRFWPEAGEKALVVLETGIWSGNDLAQIARLIASGGFATDLIAILRGSLSDLNAFNAVVSSSH